MAYSVGSDPELEFYTPSGVLSRSRAYKAYNTSGYSKGVGYDGRALEIRYSRGFRTIEDFECDTTYWLSHFINYHINSTPKFMDNYEIKSGSGRSCPLGGHLHAVFSKPVFSGFMQSYTPGPFDSFNNWRKLLAPLIMPMYMIENPKYAPMRRRIGFGKPTSNNVSNTHIEWRMPCSFLHDKELVRGILGFWCWWCDIVDAIMAKQLSRDRIIRLIDKSGFDPLTMDIEAQIGSNYSESWQKAHQEKVRDTLSKNANIYMRISPRLFEKWAGYFLPILEGILDKKTYDEDTNLIPLWRGDIGPEQQPEFEFCCNGCRRFLDVSKMVWRRGKVYCDQCCATKSCFECGTNKRCKNVYYFHRRHDLTHEVCDKCLDKKAKFCTRCGTWADIKTYWPEGSNVCLFCTRRER